MADNSHVCGPKSIFSDEPREQGNLARHTLREYAGQHAAGENVPTFYLRLRAQTLRGFLTVCKAYALLHGHGLGQVFGLVDIASVLVYWFRTAKFVF